MRVICTLPNASEEISGVKFTRLENGHVLSEEISDEAGARFLSIPGYEPAEAEATKKPASVKKTDTDDDADEQAEREALEAEYLALSGGTKPKGNWGLKRLTEEVAELREAAAKAAAKAAAGGDGTGTGTGTGTGEAEKA